MSAEPQHTHNPDKMVSVPDCPACMEDRLWMDEADVSLTLQNPDTLHDVERLAWIAKKHGAPITHVVAALAWGASCQEYFAQWCVLPESDDSVWRTLQPWIAKAQRRQFGMDEVIAYLNADEFDRIEGALDSVDRFTDPACDVPNLRLPGLKFVMRGYCDG